MRISRIGWALNAVAISQLALLGREIPDLAHDLVGRSFPDAALASGSLLLVLLSAWIVLITGLAAAGTSSAALRAVAPPALRAAVFAGAVGALTLAPAHATALGDDRAVTPREHSLTGLQLPDRPTASTAGTSAASDRASLPAAPVVVQAGDSLWRIAAQHLPAGASPADIARACAAWHAANRDVIGADPDLIFPTQRLTPPSGKDLP